MVATPHKAPTIRPPAPIMKTIQVRWARHVGHCWRSRDKLISVLLWTVTYGRAKAGQPAKIYIQQLCEDTECSPEDLPEVMNNREKWQERVRDICACGTTWWWWWWLSWIFHILVPDTCLILLQPRKPTSLFCLHNYYRSFMFFRILSKCFHYLHGNRFGSFWNFDFANYLKTC